MQSQIKIEDAVGYLNSLTYAAQFDRPLVIGIDGVMHSLVRASLPEVKTAKYLSWILQLLNCKNPLSAVHSAVEGRSEGEIRGFLKSLALKIQQDYPWAVCSRSFVPSAGTWRCYEHPEVERDLKMGETLPVLDNIAVVWEKVPVKELLSAVDALKNEFMSYYTRECLMGAVEYDPPESYSEASVERLSQVLSQDQIADAKTSLCEIFFDKNNPITQDVIKAIKFDWFENEETAAWYQKFIHGIISELE